MTILITVYLVIGIGFSATIIDQVINSLVEINPKEYKNNFLLRMQIISLITLLWPLAFIYPR
jgi:hypothetical protein